MVASLSTSFGQVAFLVLHYYLVVLYLAVRLSAASVFSKILFHSIHCDYTNEKEPVTKTDEIFYRLLYCNKLGIPSFPASHRIVKDIPRLLCLHTNVPNQ